VRRDERPAHEILGRGAEGLPAIKLVFFEWETKNLIPGSPEFTSTIVLRMIFNICWSSQIIMKIIRARSICEDSRTWTIRGH
jgi:hypothetical protein